MVTCFRLCVVFCVVFASHLRADGIQAAFDYAVTLTNDSFHWDQMVSGTPTVATTPRTVLTGQPDNLVTISFDSSRPDTYQQRFIQGQLVDCVLVTTFTRYSALWQQAAPNTNLKLNDPGAGYAIFPWVSAGDELKTYLTTNYTISEDTLDLRIAQSLGLPPSAAGQDRGLAFFWTPIANIVRPAYGPDPSVQIDYSSLLTNEDGTYIVADPGAGGAGFVFQDYTYAYFSGVDGMGSFVEYNQATTQDPWTAMGYTYNWNYLMDGQDGRALDPDRVGTYVGLSEFVISAGSWVEFDHFVANGDLYGYVVPEPGTWLLVMLGGGYLAVRRRRI